MPEELLSDCSLLWPLGVPLMVPEDDILKYLRLLIPHLSERDGSSELEVKFQACHA